MPKATTLNLVDFLTVPLEGKTQNPPMISVIYSNLKRACFIMDKPINTGETTANHIKLVCENMAATKTARPIIMEINRSVPPPFLRYSVAAFMYFTINVSNTAMI